MKKYSKYLMLITLEIIILTIFVTLQIEEKNDSVFVKDLGDEVNLYTGFEEDDIIINKVSTFNTKFKFDPLNKHYYGNSQNMDIFSLSMGHSNLKVGDVLKYKGPLSDQIYLIFRNSYPLVSLEEMNVINEDEAYFAIQLALWEMASRTREAIYSSTTARINGIRSYVGETRINERVYNSASKLVEYVDNWNKNRNYQEVTNVLTLTTKNYSADLQSADLKYLVGPVTYNVKNGIVKDAKITAKGENGDVKIDIYNDKGEKVTNLANLHKKNFYIAFSKETKHFDYTLDVSYYDLKANAYLSNNEDYAARIYTLYNDSITATINIH